MNENLYAYTAPGADMPEFISINREKNGQISVNVRSPKEWGSFTAGILLSQEEFQRMCESLKPAG